MASLLFALVLATGQLTGQVSILSALISIPALHGLCRHQLPGERIFRFVGGMTFSIYLINTIAIGAMKAVLLKFSSWDGLNFVFIFFPVLMISGVLIPILLKLIVFKKIGWLDRITS